MEGESYVPRAEGEYTRGSHSSPRAPRCPGMRPAPDLLRSRRPLRTSHNVPQQSIRQSVPACARTMCCHVGDSQESLNLVLSESRALAIRRYACMGRPGLDSDTVQRQRISEVGERTARTHAILAYTARRTVQHLTDRGQMTGKNLQGSVHGCRRRPAHPSRLRGYVLRYRKCTTLPVHIAARCGSASGT